MVNVAAHPGFRKKSLEKKDYEKPKSKPKKKTGTSKKKKNNF
jgi:hypothetical protein